MASGDGDDHKIYGLAYQCNQLFQTLSSALSARKATPEHRVVRDSHQRFELWAGYLGAFADPKASLDSRLRYSPEICDLVLQLLRILQRNIQRGKAACDVDEAVGNPN